MGISKIELLLAQIWACISVLSSRFYYIILCLNALLLNIELYILSYAVGLNYGLCTNVVFFFFQLSCHE